MVSIDECGDGNPAGISAKEVEALRKASVSDGMRWLYPYDGTIFPRGLGAPLLMWEGTGAGVVRVHMSAAQFEYEGCIKADAAGRVQIPKSAWDAAEKHTLGAKTPFTLELSALEGGTVRGPIREKLIIARASLKGSIYYNSYNAGVGGVTGALGAATPPGGGGAPGSVGLGGTVERIKPGQPAEFFSRTAECTGCHSVSANGKSLVTKEVIGISPGYVFEIDTDTQPNPNPLRTATNAAFVGLSPDGSVYLTTAFRDGVGPPTEGAIPVLGNLDSVLVETNSGNAVPNSGFPVTALMPTFSPDGTLAVFNDYASGGGGGGISLMDYDGQARKASNLRALYQDAAGFLGWPFLTPDNGAVVFTRTASPAFSGGGAFIIPLPRGPASDLMIADVVTGKSAMLARAMGFETPEKAKNNETYLPFGEEELHMAYYPTVSPVASGGYFWVFFDSVRHYGNLGLARQLWGTAIAVQRHVGGEFADSEDGLYAEDFSSPAFYLPGQVFSTANHRAFTALDPCLAEGASCEAGVDCCLGHCTAGVCGPSKTCSNEYDACQVDADCCDKTIPCIGGFCSTLAI